MRCLTISSVCALLLALPPWQTALANSAEVALTQGQRVVADLPMGAHGRVSVRYDWRPARVAGDWTTDAHARMTLRLGGLPQSPQTCAAPIVFTGRTLRLAGVVSELFLPEPHAACASPGDDAGLRRFAISFPFIAYAAHSQVALDLVVDGAPAGYVAKLVDDKVQRLISVVLAPDVRRYWASNSAPVWSPATLWTDALGVRSGPLNSDTAVFGGPMGQTVSVLGTVDIRRVEFLADGYTLQGPGSLRARDAVLELHVEPHVSARLQLDVEGPGGITKTGEGSLAISGATHFDGPLDVGAGTLVLE